MRKIIFALLILLLLSGCSLFRGNVPEGFSRESYDDMVDAYRAYEQQKIENEPKDDILSIMFEYRKLADKGKLSEAEMAVRDLISQLNLAYIGAYRGLTNKTYDITTLSPNTITAEIGTSLRIEDIKEAEDQVLTYLDLEPLPVPEEEEQVKREVHNEASTRILRFVSVGEKAAPYGYEDSYVVYRKDRDEYYVASAFQYNGRSYKYDMILDADLNFVDAYMVDDLGGLLSKPMNDDNRPKWVGNMIEAEPEQAEEDSSEEGITENSGEEEQSDLLESIYGSDKEVFLDAYGTHPDGYEDRETSEAESQDSDKSTVVQEQPESELLEWDKAAFLGGTLTDLSSALSEIRKVNDAVMSLAMDLESANGAVMILSELRNQLELMTLDPATSVHFSKTEKELIQKILVRIDAVIEVEQQMISDPSTQNIRIADSTIEEAQSLVESAQFQY